MADAPKYEVSVLDVCSYTMDLLVPNVSTFRTYETLNVVNKKHERLCPDGIGTYASNLASLKHPMPYECNSHGRLLCTRVGSRER